MPFNLQAKLLRVLQEKEINRLGSTKPTKIDVRIISATNQNINEMIENNKFREDLYYRLATIPVKIPPLRERKKDIIPIAEDILKKTINEYDLEEKNLSQEAKEALLNYEFRGNIRELINIIERAAILSEKVITKENLFLL
jgi:two-component system NtrC family response regulator